MYYETKAKVRETAPKGREVMVTHTYLTDVEFYAEAENNIFIMHTDIETYDIKRSRIKEVINHPDEGEKGFVATVASDYDIDGNKKQMKYDMLLFAPDFDEAKKRLTEYLRQGYDNMYLVKLSESKIEDIII